MLTSAIAVLAGVALLVPGFLVAELATTGRARSRGSDLDLLLRALAYALIIHLVFLWWTVDLVREVGPVEGWVDEAGALGRYAAVVLVAVPVLAGTLLNVYLRAAERSRGPLPLWAAVFGGRDARDAFDYALCQLLDGGWVIVELKGRGPGGDARYVGGTFGRESHAGLSPHLHNLYLQEEWQVDPPRSGAPPNLVGPIRPRRRLVIAAEEIATVHVITPG